jgi:hypothetical protein
MRTILGSVFTLVLVIFCTTNLLAADNLLQNPGFETGDFSFWDRSDESKITLDSDSSIYSAVFTDKAKETLSLTQKITGILEGTTYYAGAYLKNYSDAPLGSKSKAWIEVDWYKLNAQNKEIRIGEKMTSEYLDYPTDAWKFIEFSATAPNKATIAKFTLSLDNNKSFSSDRVVYFDNARMATTPAPEPVSMALFLAGGGILLVFGRLNREE